MNNTDLEEFPLISIIVPVYNVEKYVKRSIKSLTNQSYKNIEILIVNDGSTDNSYHICEELKKADQRIKLYTEKNKGQGAARNYALSKAKGQYFAFLDSDDFAEKNYISDLYNYLVNNSLDIACCNSKSYDDNLHYLGMVKYPYLYKEYSNVEAIKSLWNGGPINIGPWGKLYKSALWDNIRFKECYSEDFATMHKIFIKAKKIGFLSTPLINYVVRPNSSIRSFDDRKLVMIDIAKNNIAFTKSYPELTSAAINKAVSVAFHLLIQLPDNKKYENYRKQIIDFIKYNRKKVINDKEANNKVKIAAIISYFGFRWEKIILKISKKLNIIKSFE